MQYIHLQMMFLSRQRTPLLCADCQTVVLYQYINELNLHTTTQQNDLVESDCVIMHITRRQRDDITKFTPPTIGLLHRLMYYTVLYAYFSSRSLCLAKPSFLSLLLHVNLALPIFLKCVEKDQVQKFNYALGVHSLHSLHLPPLPPLPPSPQAVVQEEPVCLSWGPRPPGRQCSGPDWTSWSSLYRKPMAR